MSNHILSNLIFGTKYFLQYHFSYLDIGDWKMTIIEDGFAKRTRESTFVFEPINEPPVESRSKGKQPGKLAGLLLRNKYTGIFICTIFSNQNQDNVMFSS